MDIKWNPSPNFTSGRSGRKIIAIVNHITAGAFPGCLNWLCNITSSASAHYLITQTGDIYQLVREADTAWHAGIARKPTWRLHDGSNPNRRTIGIEHECISGGELTEDQYQATLRLQRELCAKYDLPIDRNHIIGHYEINPVDRPGCPGEDFPWERLMHDLTRTDALEGGEDALEKRYQTIDDIPEWGKPTINKLIAKGIIAGVSGGLDMSLDMLRLLVWNDRAGLYN